MEKGLTIIIPCYNENSLIKETFNQVDNYLSVNNDVDVLFIDDKSNDGTYSTLNELRSVSSNHNRIRLMVNEQNLGKGGSIIRGIKHARTETICFTDADLAYELSNICNFRRKIEKNKILMADRLHRDSSCIISPQILSFVFLRHCSSRIYNWLVRRILIPGIRDAHAGLKMAHKDDLQRIVPFITQKRFSFDTEFLFIASKQKIQFAKLPVRYRYVSRRSSVRFFNDSLKMFYNITAIKFRSLLGYYQ